MIAFFVLSALMLWRMSETVDEQPASAERTRAHVVRVIDGDTLKLKDGRRVRLLGINAPELGYDGERSQDGAEEARDWLSNRLTDQSVELRYGPERLDRYDRTLAWIYLPDGCLVNQELLSEGHARLVTRFGLPGDLSAELHRATAEAQVRGRGIWQKR